MIPAAPTLATVYALQTCASLVVRSNATVLIAGSMPRLEETLSDYLHLTPNVHSVRLSTGAVESTVAPEIDSGTGFSLILVQPVKPNAELARSLLQHRELRRMVLIEATWLGRKMLPEWSASHQPSPVGHLLRPHASRGDQKWSRRELSIGNFSSLMWGFTGGRMLALNRPDLADCCNARMRHHLFPAAGRRGPAYLVLTVLARTGQAFTESANGPIGRKAGQS